MPRAHSSAPMHSITVSVRVKPLPCETTDRVSETSPSLSTVKVNGSRIISVQGRDHRFATHAVVGSDQTMAYNALGAGLVEKLFNGYSCTLMAYGQTGSGKTYTMFGPQFALTETSLQAAEANGNGIPDAWGVLPRVMLHVLQRASSNAGRLCVSAIEVYQDRAYDLLASRQPLSVGSKAGATQEVRKDGSVHASTCTCLNCFNTRRKLKESGAEGKMPPAQPARSAKATKSTSSQQSSEDFRTVGETRKTIQKPSDIAQLTRAVEAARASQSHNLNERSSRSHCLITLHLDLPINMRVQHLSFTFVDLAGSERIKKSGVQGQRQEEAMGINSSLTTLGRVIRQLSKGGRSNHVPYRDSTLTMLLRSSFGGKSYTSVVINVSAEEQHVDETLCSLQFGARMSSVKNTASVVETTDVSGEVNAINAAIERTTQEVARMKNAKMDGHFGARATKVEISSFRENEKKLKLLDREVMRLTYAIAEAHGVVSSNPMSTVRDSDQKKRESIKRKKLTGLQSELEQIETAKVNIRDMIFRQKTIRGFWIAPKPTYLKRLNELEDLKRKLVHLKM